MGVVYLGRDIRLDRAVAVKALPEHLADDPDRLARFEREARTLASLSHPGIAGIYGLEEAHGQRYLVLEYVEGETLDARLARGALPADDALEMAGRIAEALEAAHEKGVIHRDLKPGNIMVAPGGAMKVLDFGLARTIEARAPGGGSAPADPTLTSPGPLPSPTIPGAIMGTAGYMSPEQARGRPVDRRSDIFSFGCVLYEMLTGTRPFAGDTVADLIGAVLHTDVDLDRLPPGTPPRVRRVLARCLARDRAARYRDIGDVLLDLRTADEAGPTATAAPRRRPWRVAAAFAAGAVLVALPAWFGARESPGEPPEAKRFGLSGFVMPIDAFTSVSISPDGRHLAIRALDPSGNPQLYFRPLGSTALVPVEGSASGWLPFFSPDGQHVAFFAAGQLRVAPVGGGPARTIASVPGGFTGGVWAAEGIVFTGFDVLALYQVPATGGAVQKVDLALPPDVDRNVVTSALPGGETILSSVRRGGRFDAALLSLADGSVQVIQENAFQPVYSPSGHILFQQGEGPLMALPFDAGRRTATGPAFPVLTDIAARASFRARTFDVAADGTLVLLAPDARNTGTLLWVDGSGTREVITRVERTIDMPRLSHDGTRLAFRTPAPTCDIWIHDFARGSTTRLTTDGDNHGIVWSADDEHIATFRVGVAAGRPIWLRSDGSGPGDDLYPDDIPNGFLADLSHDGLHVLLSGQREGLSWGLSTIDVAARRIRPVLDTRFDARAARLSPDGTLVAYVSNESGHDEVYVQPFPSFDRRVQVSAGGGTEPVWSRDSRSVYFRRGGALLGARVQAGDRLAAERPIPVFEGTYAAAAPATGLASYDVSPEGRFVMVEAGSPDSSEERIAVIVNFFSEIRRAEPGAGRSRR
jgi:Tol biopolymer transport system component